ncbi:hypothetical protein BU14_0332s0015 [Porphyra umbilicalis]|uniref:RING-type domain-containing protein n=1 Tax=Porphyra umbilicalis TaxID=2786 RepID=A0A1X6NZ42_PORUM|nr:hypothetical protein BU14_0332s0015 [Porphyra umbilicalis]|eukprot:OSX73663.1 hypothetical protein BU14_0332s0015 [Porphyra umbilicalis]
MPGTCRCPARRVCMFVHGGGSRRVHVVGYFPWETNSSSTTARRSRAYPGHVHYCIAVFPILADPDKNNLQSAQLLIGRELFLSGSAKIGETAIPLRPSSPPLSTFRVRIFSIHSCESHISRFVVDFVGTDNVGGETACHQMAQLLQGNHISSRTRPKRRTSHWMRTVARRPWSRSFNTPRDLPRRGGSCQDHPGHHDGGLAGSRQTPRDGDWRGPGLPRRRVARRRGRTAVDARRPPSAGTLHDRLGVAPAPRDATPTVHPLHHSLPCASAEPAPSVPHACCHRLFFRHPPRRPVRSRLSRPPPSFIPSLGPTCPPRPILGAAHLSAPCPPARPCLADSLRSRRVRGSDGQAGRRPPMQRLSPLSLSGHQSTQRQDGHLWWSNPGGGPSKPRLVRRPSGRSPAGGPSTLRPQRRQQREARTATTLPVATPQQSGGSGRRGGRRGGRCRGAPPPTPSYDRRRSVPPPLRRPFPPRNGDAAEALPCAHVFHARCVAAALRACRACPVCRTPVEGRGDRRRPHASASTGGGEVSRGDAFVAVGPPVIEHRDGWGARPSGGAADAPRGGAPLPTARDSWLELPSSMPFDLRALSVPFLQASRSPDGDRAWWIDAPPPPSFDGLEEPCMTPAVPLCDPSIWLC